MKMWKENRNDQEWEKADEEIALEFFRSKSWRYVLNGSRINRELANFITAPDGLNSVFEQEEFNELVGVVENEAMRKTRDYPEGRLFAE